VKAEAWNHLRTMARSLSGRSHRTAPVRQVRLVGFAFIPGGAWGLLEDLSLPPPAGEACLAPNGLASGSFARLFDFTGGLGFSPLLLGEHVSLQLSLDSRWQVALVGLERAKFFLAPRYLSNTQEQSMQNIRIQSTVLPPPSIPCPQSRATWTTPNIQTKQAKS
jgi:hypothetical protein